MRKYHGINSAELIEKAKRERERERERESEREREIERDREGERGREREREWDREIAKFNWNRVIKRASHFVDCWRVRIATDMGQH